MAETAAKTGTSGESKQRGDRVLKKINSKFKRLLLEKNVINRRGRRIRNHYIRNIYRFYKRVRLMFQDEAGFGRISSPAACWAPPKNRPEAPSQRIRQYKTVYGAVSPLDGESLFLVLDKSNTENMNEFLKALANKFPNDLVLLCADNASWHKSKDLIIPFNIRFFYIPPRTPEMNPIETVWREIRKLGFKNKVFPSIKSVIEKFWEVVNNLKKATIKSITLRDWIRKIASNRY